jgi:hypothetical protein
MRENAPELFDVLSHATLTLTQKLGAKPESGAS